MVSPEAHPHKAPVDRWGKSSFSTSSSRLIRRIRAREPRGAKHPTSNVPTPNASRRLVERPLADGGRCQSHDCMRPRQRRGSPLPRQRYTADPPICRASVFRTLPARSRCIGLSVYLLVADCLRGAILSLLRATSRSLVTGQVTARVRSPNGKTSASGHMRAIRNLVQSRGAHAGSHTTTRTHQSPVRRLAADRPPLARGNRPAARAGRPPDG